MCWRSNVRARSMPIYVDRHNASGASRADMAEAHRRDLEAQTEHGVSFLAYWFDTQQGLAFCLVEAPSGNAVEEVHRVSHGNVPSQIIEVNMEEVRSFLGRTSDPESSEQIDSGYRAIMFTDLVSSTSISLGDRGPKSGGVARDPRPDRRGGRRREGGRVVKHTGDGILACFDRVDAALQAGIRIQQELVLEARKADAS